MCAKEKTLPREVSVPKLREALRAEGVDFSTGGQGQKGLVLIG